MLKTKKESNLYTLLEAQAGVAVRAAEVFCALVDDMANVQKYTKEIERIEHEGDKLTHELQNKIAATFITPLDKEDLKELSSALDDVTDYIEAAAARAELYRLNRPRAEFVPLAALLLRVTRLTEDAVASLRNGLGKASRLKSILLDIHTVENESDELFRRALANLFDEPGTEALEVIKWKEMFDRVETAVDKCEHIAAIVGTILVKYA